MSAGSEGSILSALGINPIYLVGQVVNFLVLVLVLKRFLYKPVLKKLDERQALIKAGVEAAQKSQDLKDELEKKHHKALKKTQEEMQKLLDKAKADGREVYTDLMERGKADAAKLIEQEQEKFARYMEKQEKAVQNQVVDLSAQMAKKVITEMVADPKVQASIIDTQLKKLA